MSDNITITDGLFIDLLESGEDSAASAWVFEVLQHIFTLATDDSGLCQLACLADLDVIDTITEEEDGSSP